MHLFPNIVFCLVQGGFNKEMGKEAVTKILPQSIYPLWGRDTIPIDGVDGEAPKKLEKEEPFSAMGGSTLLWEMGVTAFVAHGGNIVLIPVI